MKKLYEAPRLALAFWDARDVISGSDDFGNGGSDDPSGLENKGDLSGDGWGPFVPVP